MLDVRDAIANVMDNTTLASLVAREEAHDVSMYFI